MNKNIWIINQYTGSPYHGMNYRSYYLAKEFIKNGHTVTIFSGSFSHLFIHLPKTKGLFTKENIDGIDYIWVKTPKYKSSKSIGRVINMLIFMIVLFFFNIFKIKKPDEIIISSLSLFPVLNAFIWSKIFKIKFIFEVRDIWPLSLIEVGNFSKKHPLVLILGFFEKLGYKKAKYVVSVLPNAKEHMKKNGMSEDKFSFIPNGIFIDNQEKEELSQEIKNKIPENKFIVGYTGTIGIANALEYLIETAILMKNNMDVYFVIVGNGGVKEKLEKKVFAENLKNIVFIDAIPKKQIQSILELFDICYIGWHNHSLYKFGISANKIFDYMYSKKPILHSISIENDIVEKSNCGITIESENIKAIEEAILKFFNMPKNDLITLGVNGQKYVLDNHTYSSLSKKYEELFI
jgi:glycosyltransferase involved in cell wall biosynthesis